MEYYPTEKDPSVRFRTMAEALSKVSRPIVYGICQWGIGDNLAEWASKMGNNWRISNDIINNWISIWRITNQVVPFAKYSKPGNWNDMDMLMVGNGRLNYEESKTHFSLWCMGKSPLFIGAGLVDGLLSKEALSILTDKEMVAINQDALGEAAKLARRYSEEEYDVWVGNLSNSRTVLTVVNWSSQSKNIVVNLADAGIQAAGRAREVWEKRDLGPLNGKYSATIPGHGVKVLVLEDTNTAGTYTDGVYNLRR